MNTNEETTRIRELELQLRQKDDQLKECRTARDRSAGEAAQKDDQIERIDRELREALAPAIEKARRGESRSWYLRAIGGRSWAAAPAVLQVLVARVDQLEVQRGEAVAALEGSIERQVDALNRIDREALEKITELFEAERAETDNLRRQLEEKKREIDAWREERNNLLAAVKELEGEMEAQWNQLQEHWKTVRTLVPRLQKARAQKKELRAQLEAMTEEAELATKARAAADRREREAKKKIEEISSARRYDRDQMTSQIHQLKTQRDAAIFDRDRARQELADRKPMLRAWFTPGASDSEETARILQILRQNPETVLSGATSAQGLAYVEEVDPVDRHQVEVKYLQKELQEKEARAEKWFQEWRRESDRAADLQKQVRTLELQLDTERRKGEYLIGFNRNTEAQLQEAQEKARGWREGLDSKAQRIGALEKEVGDLKARLSRLVDHGHALERTLQIRVQTAGVDGNLWDYRFQKYTERIQDLQRLASLNGKEAQLLADLEAQLRNATSQAKVIHELEKEVQRWKESTEAAARNAKEWAKDVGKIRSDLWAKEAELQRVKDEAAAARVKADQEALEKGALFFLQSKAFRAEALQLAAAMIQPELQRIRRGLFPLLSTPPYIWSAILQGLEEKGDLQAILGTLRAEVEREKEKAETAEKISGNRLVALRAAEKQLEKMGGKIAEIRSDYAKKELVASAESHFAAWMKEKKELEDMVGPLQLKVAQLEKELEIARRDIDADSLQRINNQLDTIRGLRTIRVTLEQRWKEVIDQKREVESEKRQIYDRLEATRAELEAAQKELSQKKESLSYSESKWREVAALAEGLQREVDALRTMDSAAMNELRRKVEIQEGYIAGMVYCVHCDYCDWTTWAEGKENAQKAGAAHATICGNHPMRKLEADLEKAKVQTFLETTIERGNAGSYIVDQILPGSEEAQPRTFTLLDFQKKDGKGLAPATIEGDPSGFPTSEERPPAPELPRDVIRVPRTPANFLALDREAFPEETTEIVQKRVLAATGPMYYQDGEGNLWDVPKAIAELVDLLRLEGDDRRARRRWAERATAAERRQADYIQRIHDLEKTRDTLKASIVDLEGKLSDVALDRDQALDHVRDLQERLKVQAPPEIDVLAYIIAMNQIPVLQQTVQDQAARIDQLARDLDHSTLRGDVLSGNNERQAATIRDLRATLTNSEDQIRRDLDRAKRILGITDPGFQLPERESAIAWDNIDAIQGMKIAGLERDLGFALRYGKDQEAIVADYKRRLQNRNVIVGVLTRRVERMIQITRDYRGRMEEAQEKAKEMEALLQDAVTDRTYLEVREKERAQAFANLEREREEAFRRARQAERLLENIRKTNDARYLRIQELDQLVSLQSDQLQALHTQYGAAADRVQELGRELEVARFQRGPKMRELEAQVVDGVNEIQLRGQRIQELEEALQLSRDRANLAEESYSKIYASRHTAEEKIQELEKDLEEKRAIVLSQSDAIARLNYEANGLRKEAGAANDQARASQLQLANLNSRLGAIQEDLDFALEREAEAKAERDSLSDQLEILSRRSTQSLADTIVLSVLAAILESRPQGDGRVLSQAIVQAQKVAQKALEERGTEEKIREGIRQELERSTQNNNPTNQQPED